MELGVGEPPLLPPSEEPELIAYLRQYGYSATDDASWRLAPGVGWEAGGKSAAPEKNRLFKHLIRSGSSQSAATVLSITVVGHEERDGHTHYAIRCFLSIRASRRLDWQVWRRLSQLREVVHDRVKSELGTMTYTRYFKDARFAPKGGLPGTTSKLSTWCSALAHVINDGCAAPRLACHVLRFLAAPDAPPPALSLAAPVSPTSSSSAVPVEPCPIVVGPALAAPCAGVDGQPAGRPTAKLFPRKLPSLAAGGCALQKRRLANITEQKVLRAGLACLAVALPLGETGALSSRVMREPLFKELLSGSLDFDSALELDVSASQPDLKHLTLPQHLAIRSRTLHVDTGSASSSTHSSFLSALDYHLCESLARWCLSAETSAQGGDGFECRCYADSRMMNRLGHQLLLIRGAIALFAEGWDKGPSDGVGFAPPRVPFSWAVVLDRDGWPDCLAALFHAEELRLQVLPGEAPSFAAEVVAGGQLAVAVERSGTHGENPASLDWDVSILDPAAAENELRNLLRQKSEAKAVTKLSFEAAVVPERRGTTSIETAAQAGA